MANIEHPLLISPFASCLSTDYYSSKNLKSIMQVYTIAHKYCAFALEQRAKRFAVELIKNNSIRDHIKPDFTAIQILRIAKIVGCVEIMNAARDAIIKDIWTGKIVPYDALEFGQEMNDPKILGPAYYQILRLGRKAWDIEPRLSLAIRERLNNGLLSLYEEWDATMGLWDSNTSQFIPHICPKTSSYERSCKDTSFKREVFAKIAASGIPSFDVLGRINIILSETHQAATCAARIRSTVEEHQRRITEELLQYFSPSTSQSIHKSSEWI